MDLMWSKLFTVVLALVYGMPVEIYDDENYNAAAGIVQGYGQDMSKVLPCAYVSIYDSKGKRDLVDEAYGPAAVRKAVTEYSGKDGKGGFAESLALYVAFSVNFKPRWAVKDVRAFVRNCYRSKIMDDLKQVRGRAIPLSQRPPYAEEVTAK